MQNFNQAIIGEEKYLSFREVSLPNINERDRERIIKMLENGDSLPLDYKHVLFPPEKKEYELVYEGKEREENILADTMSVPLQPIKTFGSNGNKWTNKLIFGDNLQIMKSLLSDPQVKGQVKLIYIDPPFATKQEFRGSQDQKAYQDKISGAKFVEFLRKRLIFLKELLHKDGGICIHLDYRKKHYIKVIMDELFGENNFRNEIMINRIKKNIRERERVKKLNEEFDTILLYSKNNSLLLLPPTRKNFKPDRWHAFDAAGFRRGMDYNIFGFKSAANRHWHWTKEKAFVAKLNYEIWKKDFSKKESLGEYWIRANKTLKFVRPNTNTGKPEYFIPASEDSLCNNLWNDISGYSFSYKYPTEKSETLLERVISMVTNNGELILDAFAGSGTTLAVAEKLGRRWIGVDCGKLAIYTMQKRLLNLKSEIGNKGKKLKPHPFTLYHAGLYDFTKLKQLPWMEWRKFALLLFNCRDEKHTISGIEMDGYKGRSDVIVFDYQKEGGVVLDYGFIDDLHSMIGSKIGNQFFIIVPAASVLFLEDYIEKGSVRYYILRIPYSIINELHNKDFEAIKQPIDESQVNDTVDAVGFDFIRQPKVECVYSIEKTKDQLLECAVINIKTFKSEAMLKGASQLDNWESLSMIMVDFGYDGKVFNLDKVFYASEIEKNDWKVFLPIEELKNQIMIIYLDIYGNEYREVKVLQDFVGYKQDQGGVS